jgi:hypothetical protein
MNQECLPAANIRRSGRMAGRLNVTFCGWCGSWLTRAGLLFWSPARLLVTAPCAGPGRVYLWPALRGGCWWPPAGSGRAWRYGAGLLVPGSARSRYCTEIRPGGRFSGSAPSVVLGRRDGSRKGRTRGARPSGGSPRPRPGTLSQARDVTSCGAGAFHLKGRIRGAWAEGRQGHVGCGEARQGPPALAHRHRLGLCGERTRPARAAGIAGGCHGPRVDRAGPGPPYRRRKPPASHPQLADRSLPPPAVATARDRFPRARWPIPPVGRRPRPADPDRGTGRTRTGPGARW